MQDNSIYILNFPQTFELDLSKNDKFATLPNLRVRRRSRIVVGETDDDSRVSASKTKGPEFILNSSLPCQEIEINDTKVCRFSFLTLTI